MNCRKCKTELPAGAVYCHMCGTKQIREPRTRKRGNGQGSVFKLANGRWLAIVTTGYERDEKKQKRVRHTRSRTCATKTEAINSLSELMKAPSGATEKPKTSITFKQLYDRWFPTHIASKSTLDCYSSAMKHFAPVWNLAMSEIDIDDLQECLDDCPRGKRTRQNMKAACGLVYKYGIPRNMIPNDRNLAQYLRVGEGEVVHRDSFTDVQIEKIKKQIGNTPYAAQVLCLIYLGFRPSEFLSLQKQQYNEKERCFVGGSKTEAGIDRTVTVSPKIQKYVDAAVAQAGETVFCQENGTPWTLRTFSQRAFYPVLEAAGIENPKVEDGGGLPRRKYTPHSCRHMFATMMKRIDAPGKDKQELIGHSSDTMLKYYQDVSLDDLRKITDAL